jgi:hypothetical protein
MDYLHFIQGFFIWGIVALIVCIITYGIAYLLSYFFGFKIRNPLQGSIIIISGVEIMYIIQTVLRELGVQPETSRYIFLMISISILIIARLYHYITQQKQKK